MRKCRFGPQFRGFTDSYFLYIGTLCILLPFIIHGNIYTYDELKATYNVNINFLQYSGMVKSVLDWKKKLNLVSTKNKMTNPILPLLLQIKNKKGTQAMFKLLSENNDTPTGKIAWNKKYRFDENEWKIIYTESFKITKDSTFQWFQTRINHNILATNTFLCKIKETMTQNVHFAQKKMKLLNMFYGNVIVLRSSLMK